MEKSQKSIQERVNKYLQTNEHKTYFIIGSTVIFILIMFVVGILPSINAVGTQLDSNGKRQEVISKLTKKYTVIQSMIKYEKDNSDLIELFTSALPNSVDQVDISIELSEIATKNGLSLETITFSDQKTNQDLSKRAKIDKQTFAQNISVTFDGPQNSASKFISDLESSIRIYNIRNILIARKGERELESATDGRTHRIILTMEVYFFQKEL